jgi:hypothetical protein
MRMKKKNCTDWERWVDWEGGRRGGGGGFWWRREKIMIINKNDI